MVYLTWSNPSDSLITKYQIRQTGDGSTSTWSDISGSSATTTKHEITGLENDVEYTFNVRAVSDGGTSGHSSATATPVTDETAPAAMVDVKHTVSGVSSGSGGKVDFSWGDPSDTTIDKYQYRYNTAANHPDDSNWSSWTDVTGGGTATTLSVTLTGSDAIWFFELRAVNDPGTPSDPDDDLNSPVTAIPVNHANTPPSSTAPVGAPGALIATASTGQVALSWTAPTGTVTGYQFRQSTDGGTHFGDWTDTGSATVGHVVADLADGTTYTFEVRARTGAGTDDAPYVYGTAARAAAATPGAPNAPTGLTVTPVTDDSTSLVLAWVWAAATENNVNAERFEYRQRPDGAGEWLQWTEVPGGGSPRGYTVLDLAGGTFYDFQVCAVSPSGASAPSNTGRAKTTDLAADATPAAPLGLGATPGDSQVTLTWRDPVDSNIDGYLYLQCETDCTDPAAVFSEVQAEIDQGVVAKTTQYTVTGLVNGTAYTFQLKAEYSNDVKSAASDSVTATPRPTLVRVRVRGEIDARINQVNETVLPELTQAMTASTLGAVSERIEQATSGSSPATLSIAGSSTIYHALESNAKAIENGSLDLHRALSGSSFVLPLNAAEGGATGGGGVTVWGSGDYRTLSGGDDRAVEWDGETRGVHVGADVKLRSDLLAGLSLSLSEGVFDYTDRTNGEPKSGDYEGRLTSVNPYVGWLMPGGADLWATVGYGWGEVEIDDEAAGRVQSSDLTQWTVAAGATGTLFSRADLIEGGTTSLKLKGEGSLAQGEVEGSGMIEGVTVDATRLRLSFEASHAHEFASGGTLTPSVELGLRHDGGDGETGTGMELGGRLRYLSQGLTIEGHGRVLVAHDGYEEWGVGGLIRLDPGVDKRGLAFSLRPIWGEVSSGVGRLWSQGATDMTVNDNKTRLRLDAELGYGLGALSGFGLLTPYGGLSLLGEGERSYRLGSRLEVGPTLTMGLEGARRESSAISTPDHSVMLQVSCGFELNRGGTRGRGAVGCNLA